MSQHTDPDKNQDRSDLMQKLLDATIDGLVQRLTQVNCTHCDARAATAQDFANARQFLKDNGFMIDPVKENDALDDLSERARQKKAPVFPSLN